MIFFRKKLKIEDFEKSPIVRKAQKEVAEELKYKKFSEVRDSQGNQYVDVVQEGGGVLGIALLGFTYILEYANIRFWRLAGTSAGAINTMLLATLGKKNEAKSLRIMNLLLSKELFDFVDGHWIVRLVFRSVMLLRIFTIFYLILPLIIILLTLLSIAFHIHELHLYVTTSIIIFISITVFIFILYKRLKKRNFGLCRGWNFSQWINEILSRQGISSVNKLISKTQVTARGAKLKCESDSSIPDSEITLIACDLTSGTKVEFPKDVVKYDENPIFHPGQFVRASMSIPLFYQPARIVCGHLSERKYKYLGLISAFNQQENFFVDGGVISNFPINIFHDASSAECIMPVVGISLTEGMSQDGPLFSNIFRYIYRIFSTVRYHYDQDFLYKHDFYQKFCVHKIKTDDFSWIDFTLSDRDKLKLFESGVLAGLKFLKEFDWDKYKEARLELYDALTSKAVGS